MIKRINSKFLRIFPLLALVGCGNPIENKTQDISNLLYTESKVAEFEIDTDTLPIGELELSETEIILERGTAHHIKALTPPFDTPTEGHYYNEVCYKQAGTGAYEPYCVKTNQVTINESTFKSSSSKFNIKLTKPSKTYSISDVKAILTLK